MLVANNPLFIEDLSGSNSEAERGSILRRRIVVKNLGDQTAEVDLWLVATNKKSEPLLRWCTFSEQNPMRLPPRESREVTLSFEIPQHAAADLYSYEVLIDAQSQYPNKPPIRRPQQLRVLPSAQDTEWGTEPIVSLQPTTHSTNPYRLQAGACLEIQVKVKNCSKRVDRYYLSCPELSKAWFSIHYPESGLETTGLIQETDGLELNPGNSGEILLKLHPPQHTPAGHYFPTVRLTSSNKADRVLLDVVYLQILPDDRLDVQLRPQSRRVPTESGSFAIDLANQGNLQRTIRLQAIDRANLFTYSITPDTVCLSPGAGEHIELQATPKHWWRRPLRGQGWELLLDLELHDIQPASLEGSAEPLPSQQVQGSIVWEPRPWWFLLLLALLGLGAVTTVAVLIWLAFFKPIPPLSPKIVQFDNSLDPATNQTRVYRQGDNRVIYLNWQIKHLKQVHKVTVIRLKAGAESDRQSLYFAGAIPLNLQRKGTDSYCEQATIENTPGLSCKGIPIPIKQAGDYTFQLQVFTKQNQTQPADSMTADTIAVEPALIPKIIELSPTKSTYQLSRASGSATASAAPIRLNWEVTNASEIKALTLVGLAPDGSISGESIDYPITNNSLPPGLSQYCVLNSNLSCRNVPITVRKSGSYAFKLTVIPKQDAVIPEIKKSTPVVNVQSPPPKIIFFKLNGQEVNQRPKYVVELNQARPLTQSVLSWQVEPGDGIKVELLPAPGPVPLQGSINYPLSKAPSRETLTLRVTNQAGEQISRTIVLETIEPRQPTPPSSTTTPATEPSSTLPSESTSTELEQLKPIELPPQ